MSVADRRTMLRGAAAAMLLPLAAAAGAHSAKPGARFSPPDGPLR